MTRWLPALLLMLMGCIAAEEDEGPCPCAAPLACCVAVDRCLPPDSPCFATPVEYALVLESAALDPAGGTEVRVALDPPGPIDAVFIGATECARLEADPFRCTAPAWRGARAQVDVEVRSGGRRLGFDDAVTYALPDFAPWPGAPLPAAHAAVPHAGQLIVATADGAPIRLALAAVLGLGDPLPLVPLTSLHVEDLDRDGALDLLGLPLEAPPIRAALDGTTATPWWTGPSSTETVRGLLADLDGDGYADLIGHTERRGGLAISRTPLVAHGGPDGFTPEAEPSLPVEIFDEAIRDYVLVDYDVDGDSDLALCGDRLWLVTFEDGVIVDTLAAAPPPVPCGAIAVIDVNRDGRPDLVWTPALDYAPTDTRDAVSGVYILRNGGNNFLLATPQASVETEDCVLNRAADSTLGLGRSELAAFDVDLDGDIDIFLPAPYSRCAGRLVWYENAGDRFILRPVPGTAADPQPSAVRPADLDGDGDLDVVVTAAPPYASRVWRNLHAERGPVRGLVVRPTSADARSVRGARVSLVTDDRVLVRVLGSEDSGDARAAHFGLGSTAPPWVGVVRWPDGVEIGFEADAPGLLEVPRP